MILLDAWTVHGQFYLISDGMIKGDHVICVPLTVDTFEDTERHCYTVFVNDM